NVRRPGGHRASAGNLLLPAVLALSALAVSAASGRAAEPPAIPARLTLAQAVSAAVQGAAPVQVADLKLREAEQRRTQSRAALLPALGGAASVVDRTFNLKALGFSFPKIPGVASPPDLIGPVDVMDARVRASPTLL